MSDGDPPPHMKTQLATSFDLPQATLQQGTEPPKYEEAIDLENATVDTQPPNYDN